MAEDGNLSHSFVKGSDVLVENPCSVCLSSIEAQYKESTNYCVDCETSLCQDCNQLHSQSPSKAGHQIVDIDQVTQLPTERCTEHHGKLIDQYCPDHDQVGCVSCVAQDHRLCKKMTYIGPHIAKGTKQSMAHETLKSSTKALIKDFNAVKLEHQYTEANIDKEEKASLGALQDIKQKLVKQSDDLVETDMENVTDAFKGIRQGIKTEMKAVDDSIQKLESSYKNLDQCRGDNETQLFVYIKQAEQNNRDCQKVFTSVNESKFGIPKFTINNSTTDTLMAAQSLGWFPKTVALAQSEKIVSVRQSDNVPCSIGGCCLLPDGTLILFDDGANCIHHMDVSYKVINTLYLTSKPSGVCFVCQSSVSGICQIAVSMESEKKVQLITVGKSLKDIQSFSILDYGRGICHADGELFICCGDVCKPKSGHIKVYNLSGIVLRDIRTNSAGKAIFSVPNYITFDANTSELIITDRQNGVITMDKTGKVKSIISNSDLTTPSGVCSIDDGDLLVCGMDSNNLVQVRKDGTTKTVIQGNSNELNQPVGICYDDSAQSRVIVTERDKDHIKIFDLL